MRFFSRTTTSRRNEVFRSGLIVSFLLLCAPLSFASQSLIGQKSGFNSDKQLSFITYTSIAIDEKAFVGASFTYSRTSEEPSFDDTDTFYQGTLSLGYAVQNIGFDVGFNVSRSPLQDSRTIGGTFGLTYIYTPSGADPDDYSETALDSLHTQLYKKQAEQPPLFWVRFGFIGNTLRSNLLAFPNDSGKETALSVDVFYPYSPELLFTAGTSFHGYDDSHGFFDRSLKNTTSTEISLLASTVQGLPHTTVSMQATWQLALRDSFIPRYQATEIDSSRVWSHTLDLSWRHQFTSHWYLTPTYELTVLGQLPATAIMGEVLYSF